jgi:membrane fusion protein, heavy metal efflux system
MKTIMPILFSVWLALLSANANAAEIVLPLAQQQSLGISVTTPIAQSQMQSKRFPAEITVPIGQERVVSSAQAGLLDALYFAAGQEVKQGQAIAHITSPELVNAQREYLQAKGQHGLNQKTYLRDKELWQDGIIAERRYLETEQAYQSSEADLAQKKQALKLTGMSETAITRLISPANIQTGITLTAPITGQIMEQLQTVGARVDIATPVYRIGRLNPLWAEIHVPMESLPSMQIGMAVSIPKLSASGKLITIVRSVNKDDQTLHLRAEITQGAERLSPGQFVEAEIQLGTQTGNDKKPAHSFSLPKSALVRQGQQSWIFVQTAKGFRPLAVKVLGEQADEVLVSAELTGKEAIASAGTTTLKGMWLGIGAE